MTTLFTATSVLKTYAPHSFLSDSLCRLSEKLRNLTEANQTLAVKSNDSDASIADLQHDAIICCKETREVAFFADLQAMVLDDEQTRELIEDCFAEIRSTANLLCCLAPRIAPDFPPIFRYIESTQKRLNRLDAIINEGMAAAHLRMASETSIQPIKTARDPIELAISTKWESLQFAIAQWYGHRLVCLIAELSLESGPYHDALRQYSDLISMSIAEVAPFVNACRRMGGKPNCDATGPLSDEIDRTEKFLESMVKSISSFIIELKSDHSANSENVARNAVVSIVNAFQHRHHELNLAIDQFCSDHLETGSVLTSTEPSEDIHFIETANSAQATSRILLVQENDERGKWTALGLDYPIVVFGKDMDAAVEAYGRVLNGTLKLKKRMKPLLAYENLYKNLQDLKEFNQFQVRALEPIQ